MFANNMDICKCCLSSERKLIKSKKYLNMYFHIIGTKKRSKKPLTICWECKAYFDKIIKFNNQVRKAHDIIQKKEQCFGLSKLQINLQANIICLEHTEKLILKEEKVGDDDEGNISSSEALEIFASYDDSIKMGKLAKIKNERKTRKSKYKIVVLTEEDKHLLVEYNLKKNNQSENLADLRNSDEIVHRCTLCFFETARIDDIDSHVMQHCKLYECMECGLQFVNRDTCKTHIDNLHTKYVCDICSKCYAKRKSIEKHFRNHHRSHRCTPCNKTFARYNGLWIHNKLKHNKCTSIAYCVECDKQYSNIYSYKFHLNNAHRPRKKICVPCPDCGKIFTKKIYMKNHRDLIHLKIFKFRCEECNKNFIRNSDLVKHRKVVHDGILLPKNKICYICGRGFTCNKVLVNHIRVHTGERPFCCDQCPSRFAQKSALSSHLKNVHRNK